MTSTPRLTEVTCNECNKKFKAPEDLLKEGKKFFCSIECACYAGAYNVNTGWKHEQKD